MNTQILALKELSLPDLENLIRTLGKNTNHYDWINNKIKEISGKPEIETNSIIAELTAFIILHEVFSETQPISVKRAEKTPDFSLGENIYVEVYCPQESQPERKKIDAALDRQSGNVRVTLSRPVTGSDGNALKYTANKAIDRILNAKRSNDQTQTGAANILWVDLVNGLSLYCIDTLPYRTTFKGDENYIGSFGVWHAFYGKKDVSKFAYERTSLQHIDKNTEFYIQQQEGLFRKRPTLDLLRKSSWLLDETLKNMDVLGEFSLFRSKSIVCCNFTYVGRNNFVRKPLGNHSNVHKKQKKNYQTISF